MTEAVDAPPFIRIGPEEPVSPVILSVPHAGRDYRPELLKASRLPKHALEALEDRLADQLAWRATSAGMTAFVATAPRAEIDLNRDEREIDPLIVSPPLPPASIVQSARSRGGIGLIPSRIAGAGAIWLKRIPRQELDRRIAHIHRPYHQALEAALKRARAKFGSAVLLDCHSMPPRPPVPGQGQESHAKVVFGDRFGTTIAPDLLAAAVAASRALGFRTACNTPYAGGFVATRHGRPSEHIHAVQVELDRSIYLDPELRSPGPGFDSACRLILAVAQALESQLLAPDQAIAAE